MPWATTWTSWAVGIDGGDALGHDVDVLVLGRAVGVEEVAGEVDDRIALPSHADAGLASDLGDHGRLEVLLGGVAHELLDVGLGHGHGHTLLGLGDCELGAIEAVVLLGDHVERPSYFLVTMSRSM